jgi:hypothetical protein
MSPPPSKSLIWSHEPITSPREIAAIDNFHQLPDATLVSADAHYSGCGAQSPVSGIFLPVAEDLCRDLPAILIRRSRPVA